MSVIPPSYVSALETTPAENKLGGWRLGCLGSGGRKSASHENNREAGGQATGDQARLWNRQEGTVPSEGGRGQFAEIFSCMMRRFSSLDKGGRGSHGLCHKNAVSKISKQLALEFARRTLIRCQRFEETGQSCFSESPMQDVLFSVSSHNIDTKYLDAPGGPTSGLTSNSSERHGQKHEFLPHQGLSNMPVQPFGKADPFFNRAKKKEALLDDVVTSAASRAASTPYSAAPVGPKWKKSDKEKDHARDVQVKSSGAKVGRPSLSGGRGDRKNKTKPKQRIAQLSTSGNGLARPCETSSETTTNGGANANRRLESQPRNGANPDLPKDLEDAIFTNLPINGIDEIDVAEGLGGQGQDIGSWLNVDEDLLQGHDLVGLEIPMDDLSDLKLTF